MSPTPAPDPFPVLTERERAVDITLSIITAIFMSLRIYARVMMTKNWGLDDTLASIAWVCYIATEAINAKLLALGEGRDIKSLDPDVIPKFMLFFTLLGMFFFIGSALVRISIAAFIPRLSREKYVIRGCWVITAGIIANMVVALFLSIFQCKPIRAGWDFKLYPTAKCLNMTLLYYVSGVLGIVFDLALMYYPQRIIRKNMIFTVTSIKIMLIFAVGFLSVAAGVARLIITANIDLAKNVTYATAQIGPYISLEAHAGLWAASFPALQPILRWIPEKVRNFSRISIRASSAFPSFPTFPTWTRRSKRSTAGDRSSELRPWQTERSSEMGSIVHPQISVSSRAEMKLEDLGVLPDCGPFDDGVAPWERSSGQAESDGK